VEKIGKYQAMLEIKLTQAEMDLEKERKSETPNRKEIEKCEKELELRRGQWERLEYIWKQFNEDEQMKAALARFYALLEDKKRLRRKEIERLIPIEDSLKREMFFETIKRDGKTRILKNLGLFGEEIYEAGDRTA
jgi:hypothetical protein